MSTLVEVRTEKIDSDNFKNHIEKGYSGGYKILQTILDGIEFETKSIEVIMNNDCKLVCNASELVDIIEVCKKKDGSKKTIKGWYSFEDDRVYLSYQSIFETVKFCMNYKNLTNGNFYAEKVPPIPYKSKVLFDSNRFYTAKSLCIIDKNKGNLAIKRLADIEDDGSMQIFKYNKEEPGCFENRLFLSSDNHGYPMNHIAVWEWEAVVDKGDSSKDYVKIKYSNYEEPIEIHEIKEAKSIKDVIEILNTGIAFEPVCDRVIFFYKSSTGKLKGVLCDRTNMKFSCSTVSLKKDVSHLDIFLIDGMKRLTIKSLERNILKTIFLPEPVERFYFCKNETVRDIILENTSELYEYDYNENDVGVFKQIIDEMPKDSIYSEVAAALECSEEEAEKYVEDFIKQSKEYFTYKDFDKEVLLRIVENNPLLKEELAAEISDKWVEAHQAEIAKADKEIETLEETIAHKKHQNEELQIEIEKKQKRLDEITSKEKEYDDLLVQIDEKSKKKMQEIKNDVSDFVSELSFMMPFVQQNPTEDKHRKAFREGVEHGSYETNDWKDCLFEVEDQLKEAGVGENYCLSFAIFLYSAYLNNMPVLLAGPCGESIAHTFSVAMFGKTAGILDCSEPYNLDEIEYMLSGNDDVIIVKNPFTAEWYNNIMGLLMSSKKFYIVVNPLVEDMLIEPKSLYNYLIPIITESIVENLPKETSTGYIRTEEFDEFKIPEIDRKSVRFFESLDMNGFLKKRYGCVLATMVSMYNEAEEDPADEGFKYLYCAFPYMYFTQKTKKLTDKIREDNAVNDDLKKYILNYLEASE